MSQLAVRCRNTRVHQRGKKLGNIVCIVAGNKVYVRCDDSGCRVWTELTFEMPGVNLDLSKAAISQRTLRRRMQFQLTPAPVTVVEG